MRRGLVLVAVLLATAAPASAAGSKLTSYPVPRGGFSIMVPSTWIDVTNTTPTPGANGKVPTVASIARAAAADGTKKLIVVDPKGNGFDYIDVDVERIGTVAASVAAGATVKELQSGIPVKGKVSLSRVKVAAGPAYLIHFVYKRSGNTYETSEYLIVHDQIEYLLVYVAPQATWSSYAAEYAASAASFRLLGAPALGSLVLKSAQVGSGYKSSLIQFGNSFIGEVTLDLCAGSYPSESLRTGRIQMRYLHAGKAVPVSNEVVSYTPGGAAEALREVRSVSQTCARKPVVLKHGAVTNTFSVTPIKDSKLLPGAVAVRVVVTAADGKKHAKSVGIAVYQEKNNTLSGIYAWAATGTTIAQATRIGLHAAEESARNLGGLSPLTA